MAASQGKQQTVWFGIWFHTDPLIKQAALLWTLEIESSSHFFSLEDLASLSRYRICLLTILALRERGELSKRDCYRWLGFAHGTKIFTIGSSRKTSQPQVITETYRVWPFDERNQINGGILIRVWLSAGPDRRDFNDWVCHCRWRLEMTVKPSMLI